MKYYFTWGSGQGHDGCYTVIDADDNMDARLEMIRIWGRKWGFQYESAEETGVERFGLKLI